MGTELLKQGRKMRKKMFRRQRINPLMGKAFGVDRNRRDRQAGDSADAILLRTQQQQLPTKRKLTMVGLQDSWQAALRPSYKWVATANTLAGGA
jgi:hypothetical protein